MRITLEYATQLKAAAGVAEESFDLPAGAGIQELLESAAEKHGAGLRRILFDSGGRVHPSLLVFVGDTQVRAGESPRLNGGDTVTILSPISGG